MSALRITTAETLDSVPVGRMVREEGGEEKEYARFSGAFGGQSEAVWIDGEGCILDSIDVLHEVSYPLYVIDPDDDGSLWATS